MTKIAFAAAAVLLATGTAFAGSDHYGSENDNRPSRPVAANIGHMFSASIRNPIKPNKVDSATEVFQPEPGQGIWGQ